MNGPEVVPRHERIHALYVTISSLRERLSSEPESPTIKREVLTAVKSAYIDVFELPAGFTYEEVPALIQEKAYPSELSEQLIQLSQTLTNHAYAPKTSSSALLHITDASLELLKLAGDFEVHKRNSLIAKALSPVTFFSRIGSFLKKITSIFWFPFYLAYASYKRYHERKHLHKDPAYRINMLLAKGNAAIERSDLKLAIDVYDAIKEEYEAAGDDLKTYVRPKIIAYYQRIVQKES